MAEHTEDELLAKLYEARDKVKFGATYRHYKHRTHQYKVQGFGIIEATGSIGVIYQAQYGQRLTFIRPLGSFLDEVEVNGKRVPRFKEVEQKPYGH